MGMGVDDSMMGRLLINGSAKLQIIYGFCNMAVVPGVERLRHWARAGGG